MILGEFIIGATVGFAIGAILRRIAVRMDWPKPEVTIALDIPPREVVVIDGKEVGPFPPCPWCHTAVDLPPDPVEVGGKMKAWALGCETCGAIGPMCESKVEAIKAWVKRDGKAVAS